MKVLDYFTPHAPKLPSAHRWLNATEYAHGSPTMSTWLNSACSVMLSNMQLNDCARLWSERTSMMPPGIFHGRLSHAGVGYAMRHSRLHCYIGDRRVERVLTPEFLDQSDLVDRNASLSWFDNNK